VVCAFYSLSFVQLVPCCFFGGGCVRTRRCELLLCLLLAVSGIVLVLKPLPSIKLVQMPVRCHGKKNHVHTDTYISPVFSLTACCYVHGCSNSFSDCCLFSTLTYIFSTTIVKLPNFVVPDSSHSVLHRHCYLVWTSHIFIKSLLFSTADWSSHHSSSGKGKKR
jgi:hypothetical protein